MSRLRVGIVGGGRWAVRYHLPSLAVRHDVELVGLVEPDVERRRLVAARFGIERQPESVAELLDHGCEAVVVSSPPVAHHAAAATALDAGVAVLVEKPLTITTADAWDLVERARSAGAELMVGYTFQFTPAAEAAESAIAGGAIGALQLVTGVYSSPMAHLFDAAWPATADPLDKPVASTFADPAVAGGGQGPSQLTHLLAALLNASGAEPRRVNATYRPEGDPMERQIALVADLGDAVASVGSSGTMPAGSAPVWSLTYFGDGGTLHHDLCSGELVLDCGGGERRTLAPPASEPYPASAVAPRFVDVVGGRASNPSPGELGARSVALLDAARRSAAADGNAVVPELR